MGWARRSSPIGFVIGCLLLVYVGIEVTKRTGVLDDMPLIDGEQVVITIGRAADEKGQGYVDPDDTDVQEEYVSPAPVKRDPKFVEGSHQTRTERRVRADGTVQTGEWRAVKVLRADLSKRGKIRKRFKNEANTMMNLNHRHVIKVFDVYTDAAQPYFVMELARGGCLIDWSETHGKMPARIGRRCGDADLQGHRRSSTAITSPSSWIATVSASM